MSAVQLGVMRLLAPIQVWEKVEGYPCLYSHNNMQSNSPRRPQTEHACSRAQSAVQAVESVANLAASRDISRAMAISVAASCICMAPKHDHHVVFDELFACAFEERIGVSRVVSCRPLAPDAGEGIRT